MRNTTRALLPAILAASLALPAAAQAPKDVVERDTTSARPAATEEASLVKETRIQHIRPNDRRGINVFEPPKNDGIPFTGFKLDLGAAFTQQFQSLDHDNSAAPNVGTGGVDANKLMDIGTGFNNATANLYLDAQLADGIRVALTTYLSSRHHRETWVKDGYLLIDGTPIKHEVLEGLMKYVTLKVGHFEINYGDQHFRRSDNGQALFNPFVGNLILDAFTTEIGAEAYFRTGPFLAMAGMTGGEIRGTVTAPDQRSWAYLGKVGFDQQFTDDLRVRLTGSVYTNDQAASSTLYGGDRAGSRYYLVLENTAAADDKQFTSGLVNPGFKNQVTAFMVNPFVKFRGLELFGTLERAEGKATAEAEERSWTQYAGDAIYRLYDDRLYLGARYNVASGELAGMADKVEVQRWQFGAGWFVTPSVLLKGEYVTQKYNDFPTTDIRNGGKFNGFMVEGTVAF
jgi:hypothetical protein